MQRVPLCGAPFAVFLDYAHTPAALQSLLETVRGARRPGQRITLLFGCGGDRDSGKRPIMGRIASEMADQIILTSDNCRSEKPESILADILRGVSRPERCTVIAKRSEAIRYAVAGARAGDILLLAGKGHEKYEIDAEGKHPFDEEALVCAAWRRRATSAMK